MEGFNLKLEKLLQLLIHAISDQQKLLLGDPTEAEKVLGWKPTISFQDLVKEMAEEDLRLAERDQYIKNGGYGA